MTLSDFLTDLYVKKKNLLQNDPQAEKLFASMLYPIRRCLSYHQDCIMQVEFLNCYPMIDPKMQYDFLLNTIKSRKRFAESAKPEKLESLQIVKEYFGYNTERAKEALELLTEDNLNSIRESMTHGGIPAAGKPKQKS